MTRDELFFDILAARPRADDLVYIERCGEDYAWRRTSLSNTVSAPVGGALPDAWIYYSGRWPSEDEGIDRWREFFNDLIAEMESMAGGADRCRWPLDDLWPRGH